MLVSNPIHPNVHISVLIGGKIHRSNAKHLWYAFGDKNIRIECLLVHATLGESDMEKYLGVLVDHRPTVCLFLALPSLLLFIWKFSLFCCMLRYNTTILLLSWRSAAGDMIPHETVNESLLVGGILISNPYGCTYELTLNRTLVSCLPLPTAYVPTVLLPSYFGFLVVDGCPHCGLWFGESMILTYDYSFYYISYETVYSFQQNLLKQFKDG